MRWFEALGWRRGATSNLAGAIAGAADEDGAGPATFATLRAGEAQIFLCKDHQGLRGGKPVSVGGGHDVGATWSHWWLDTPAAVDRLYQRAVTVGALVMEPPTDRPWGERELVIAHAEGHVFRVSAPLRSIELRPGPPAAGPVVEAEVSFGVSAAGLEAELDAEVEAIQRKLTLELGVRSTAAPRREVCAREHIEESRLADLEVQLKLQTQQIARLEVMLRHHARSVDARFEAAFEAWAEHFKAQLTTLVQSTIATLVEGHVTTRLARHALQLKQELSSSVTAGVGERIDLVIAARIDHLQDVVVAAVERNIERRMDAFVDHKLGPIQQSTTAQVLKEIDALLQASVAQTFAGARVSLDGDIEGRLLETQNKLERLQNELTARLTQGDSHLKSWITAQLIELKGCMTDRQTLVALLGEFVAEAERRLAQAPCLDIHRWVDPSDGP